VLCPFIRTPLQDALARASQLHVIRDVAEIFSGAKKEGAVADAASRKGYKAVSFDLYRKPGTTDVEGPECENMLWEAGFLACLDITLSIRQGGLLVIAVDCSSFTSGCRCVGACPNRAHLAQPACNSLAHIPARSEVLVRIALGFTILQAFC